MILFQFLPIQLAITDMSSQAEVHQDRFHCQRKMNSELLCLNCYPTHPFCTVNLSDEQICILYLLMFELVIHSFHKIYRK